MKLELLQQLMQVHSPSGEEHRMATFIQDYVKKHQSSWRVTPELVADPALGDSLFLVFGQPRTAVFAHMDTIGFMVRYGNQLIPIGGPEVASGYELVGEDQLGPVQCRLTVDKHHNLFHDMPRAIDRGTSLIYKPNLQISQDFIQSPYLDNRLGIYNALKLCETLENGIVAFSCFEEQGGGSVPTILHRIMQKWPIQQALISDITWITEGVKHGEGVVISIRDRNIPRRSFVDRIIELAATSKIKYQLEVEAAGSSDGREVHQSPYGIDWCFIGAGEDNVHTPKETVHKADLQAMLDLYQYLLYHL